MNVKLIPVTDVKAGMYIEDADNSWWKITEVVSRVSPWITINWKVTGGRRSTRVLREAHVLAGIEAPPLKVGS